MSGDREGRDLPEEPEEFYLGDGVKESPDQKEAAPPGFTIEEVPEKKGGAARLFVLLLLLIAVAGAGYFLFENNMSGSDEAVVVVKETKPTKIKVPVRPVAEAAAEKVKEEVVSKEKVAAVPTKVAPAVVPSPKAQVKPPAAFALSSGSYLYHGALDKARAQIEKRGYKVSVSEQAEMHEMTRLLVGQYDRALATKRLSEVKPLADGAFIAAEDGKFSVYAGSFLSLDKARRAADLLYANGIRVEERQVKVSLPRTTLKFGAFTTRAEALEAAKTLKKNGVKDPEVVPYK